jgi:hypothetical protein
MWLRWGCGGHSGLQFGGTGVVLGWCGHVGGGEVIEVSQWVAFRRVGVFVLLTFRWLGLLEVTRRCCGAMVERWCCGVEKVFRWHLVFVAVGLCG